MVAKYSAVNAENGVFIEIGRKLPFRVIYVAII